MKTICPPGYHHNGLVAAYALGHMMYGSSFIRAKTFIIKMPCSTTTIFVGLNIRFVDSKFLLKINS